MKLSRIKSVVKRKKKKKFFGKKINPLIPIHPILKECIDILKTNHLATEELFTKTPNKSEVEKIILLITKQQNVDLTKCSPLTLVEILKKYFSELPEPLFTTEGYNNFLQIVDMNSSQQEKELYTRLDLIPSQNRIILDYFFTYLQQYLKHEFENFLSIDQISEVWAPILLTKQNELKETTKNSKNIKFFKIALSKHKPLDFGKLNVYPKLTLNLIGNLFLHDKTRKKPKDTSLIQFSNPKIDYIISLHNEIDHILKKDYSVKQLQSREIFPIKEKIKKITKKNEEIQKKLKLKKTVVSQRKEKYDKIKEGLNEINKKEEDDLSKAEEMKNKSKTEILKIEKIKQDIKNDLERHHNVLKSYQDEIESLKVDLEWHDTYIEQLIKERDEIAIVWKTLLKKKKNYSVLLEEEQKELDDNQKLLENFEKEEKEKTQSLNTQRKKVIELIQTLEVEKENFENEKMEIENELNANTNDILSLQQNKKQIKKFVKDSKDDYLQSKDELKQLNEQLNDLNKTSQTQQKEIELLVKTLNELKK
ncbi:rho gtpase-activating protein 68f [Anaeramoeba flamelloides]|uniref:Rho gtpase-activating protein 68f n=1 Tax=Anaeramoeba flamelloides TaxID=1746091 RepID=A0AAV7Z8Y0_9EUKA|nr:rho gtpase-activating protein 68f [Anaeramoeba flamelloides]